MNKVFLIGNLTADPVGSTFDSGNTNCRFSIAVNRFSRGTEGNAVDFINIVAWRQTAEFVCKYFHKGRSILVCGQIQTRTWQDNQGQKRYATEVVADEVSFVANAAQNGAPMGQAPMGNNGYTPEAYGAPSFNSTSGAGFEEIPNDESLPF